MLGLYPTLALIVFIGIVFVFLAIGREMPAKFVTVKIGKATVNAELADNEFKQMRGLMFRESLPKDGGMLFDFAREGEHGIWMMNMSMPIDVVWMDKEKRVTKVMEDVQPCDALLVCPVHYSGKRDKYVLELNSGYAKSHGIREGSVAKFGKGMI